MDFSASAPCKCILFGEHYVVYGASALSIPIEPRNTVKFSATGSEGISLISALGTGRVLPDGSYSGEPSLSPFSAVASHLFKGKNIPSCAASFEPAWSLKGVGTSSSLAAAFAAGLLHIAKKKPGARKIFASAQAGDIVAHQGKASGIDAKTVSSGKTLVFTRKFSPLGYNVRSVKFSLPQGSSLLLINTFSGTRGSTAAMLAAFARSFGITTLPQDAPEEKRQEIQREFSSILKSALAAKTPSELGKLMNDNHLLLRMRGVSSPSIEKAISAAHTCGAWGAKLTGGGGEGGAVLALCRQGEAASFAARVSEATGFACQPISLASTGARVD